MQRMFNLDKWAFLDQDKFLNLENIEARRVRVDVNAPVKTRLSLVNGDGEVRFLALVEGRDAVEVWLPHGTFSLTADAGIWLSTVDGEDFSFSIPDAKILTRLVERRVRNPELEMMQHMLNQNIERRLSAQRTELEQLWARREAARTSVAEVPAPAGGDEPAPREPKPKRVPASDPDVPAASGPDRTTAED